MSILIRNHYKILKYNNKLLLLNLDKNINLIYLDFIKENKIKNGENFKYDGFLFNNLLKLTMELKNNEFSYFPKLKLQKLNKFDKSRSEVQSYNKELFFEENPEYLDLDIMNDEIKQINILKNLITEIKNSKKIYNPNQKLDLLNLRWYIKEKNINIEEDKTSDKLNNNKSISTKENKIFNHQNNINENYLLWYYENTTNYFNFLIKIFELDLINNLNEPKELLNLFNKIYSLFSKLIIIVDEIFKPINNIINIKFNESFDNLPKYPKFNYFKYLVKIFYKDFYLNFKEYLDKSFFKLLKIRMNNNLNELKKENINEEINKKNEIIEINNIIKDYIIFLEDISYNEININFNCYSKLNSNNEIEKFKEKFMEKSIKFYSKNNKYFLDNPLLINKFLKVELAILSDLVLENFYWIYVMKVGTFFLKGIRGKLINLITKYQDESKNNNMEENLKLILLKKNSIDYFFDSFSNILNYNVNALELESYNSFNEVNNANYLFNNNIDNFKVLTNTFFNLEKFCENILHKLKENDNHILEFNKKRGIPWDIGDKKELYDLVSDIRESDLYKKNIENWFIDEENSILNYTICSLKSEDQKEEKIKKNFKLPGYETIINNFDDDDDDFDDSFEELTL